MTHSRKAGHFFEYPVAFAHSFGLKGGYFVMSAASYTIATGGFKHFLAGYFHSVMVKSP